ncbi:nuclear pore complex protein Nup98-Nup96-like [Convolutriloba macropyga]|uniref:nuclear pore complex protein Nup98-Nup96-like n=1 Tax=Convolutriloba macropyga TaxID=536237 RepID=UPI003F521065
MFNKPTGLATSFSLGGGGGLFGGTNQTQQTPQTGGLFGSQPATQQTSGFLFGQPQQQQQQQQPQSTFSGFGGGLLGTNQPQQQQQNAFSFGGGSTNLFNRPNTTFGAQTATSGTGGLFGGQAGSFNTTAAPVGTTIKFNPTTGTDTMMKNGISTSVSTKHNCLTAMKEYEAKSLEELRMEDYAANRKTGTLTTGAGGLFGSSAGTQQTTGGLFGGTTGATAQTGTGFGGLFGANQQQKPGGLFGSTSTASTGGGLFGGQQQTGSLFGGQNKPATGGLFGGQTQQGTTGGLFGGTGTFGSTQQQGTTGGLFGSSTFGSQANKNLGLTTTTTGSMFNFGGSTTTTQAGGLFGTTQNKPLFGGTTGGFGATGTSTAGGLFGSTQTNAGGLFGNKPLGFGTTTSTTGGLFGTQPAQNTLGQTGSLFGGLGGTQQPALGGGSLFGNPVAGTAGLALGAQATQPVQLLTDAATANAQHQMLQQQILGLAMSPYGDSPLFRNSLVENKSKKDEITKPINPSSQKPYLSPAQHKIESKPTLKVKPNSALKHDRLFDGLDDDYQRSPRPSFVPKSNPKKLVIKEQQDMSFANLPLSVSLNMSQNGSLNNSDLIKNNPQAVALSFLLGTDKSSTSFKDANSSKSASRPASSTAVRDVGTSSAEIDDAMTTRGKGSNSKVSVIDETVLDRPITTSESTSIDINVDTPTRANQKWATKLPNETSTLSDLSKTPGVTPIQTSYDRQKKSDTYESLNSSLDSVNTPLNEIKTNTNQDKSSEKESLNQFRRNPVTSPRLASPNSENNAPFIAAKNSKMSVKLTRPEYFTDPEKRVLDEIVQSTGKCIVEDFTIGRDGYGNVHFPGKTDLTGIDLDEIVHIRRKEITIYPDDERKPPLGEGLNKRAVVTLDKVWPNDKSTQLPITSPQKLCVMNYAEKIERSTAKLPAKFIEYRPETGSWVFEVKHFSKYTLADDSDDDDENVGNENGVAVTARHTVNTHVGEKSDSLKKKNHDETFVVEKPSLTKFPPEKDVRAKTQFTRGLGGGDSLSSEIAAGPEHSTVNQFDFDSFRSRDVGFGQNFSLAGQTMNLTSSSLFAQSRFAQKLDPMTESLFAIPEDSNSSVNIDEKTRARMKRKSALSGLTLDERADFLMKQYRIEKFEKVRNENLLEHEPNFEGLDLDTFPEGDIKENLTRNPVSNNNQFRVSWKSSSTSISCPTSQNFRGLISLFTKPNSSYQVVSCNVFDDISNHFETDFVENILNNVYEYSASDMGNSFPRFSFIESTDFVKDLNSSLTESNVLKSAISLCHALFGAIDRDMIQPNPTGDSYEVSQLRRSAFSDWLTKVLDEELCNDYANVSKSLTQPEAFQRILLLYSCNQKEEAINVALEADCPRLALLLAQDSCPDVRNWISMLEIEISNMNLTKHVNESYMQLLKLISGNAISDQSEDEFNIATEEFFIDFSWKRALGACLWFLTNQSSTVKEVVELYEKMCNSGLMQSPFAVRETAVGKNFDYFDVCYHILQLFVDPTSRPEMVLNPLTFAQNITDYFSTWTVMSALITLGFVNIEIASENNVITNFAFQLEREKMWHWAAFVLSFIKSDQFRKNFIQDLMDRNCSSGKDFTPEEQFLVDKLNYDESVIRRSKSLRAAIDKDFNLKLYHLVEAQDWKDVHKMLIEQGFAAELYFAEDEELLMSILTKLDAQAFAIPNWLTQGALLLEYFTIEDSRQRLIQNLESSSTENLNEALNEISDSYALILKKLPDFPVTTDRMRFLMAEITESVVAGVNSFEMVLGSINNLPLFNDQVIALVNQMANSSVKRLTSLDDNDDANNGDGNNLVTASSIGRENIDLSFNRNYSTEDDHMLY